MLNLQGPESRALLASLSPDDLSNKAFPFGTCRSLRLGYQTVLAIRLTYVGELGYELYVPTSFVQPVYDALVLAGERHDLRHCGYHALNSLRIEKAYRDWSHDVGPDDNPFEAGLAFTCSFDKPGGFIGRDALQPLRDAKSPGRRLVQFRIEDPDVLVYHNEPIYAGDERVGIVTSGMYGHTIGAPIAMGYVRAEHGVSAEWLRDRRFEIDAAGRRVDAIPSLSPLYDPRSERPRG